MNALRAWLCRDATHFLPAVNAGKLGTVFGQVFLMQSNSPMYYLTKFMKEATKKLPIFCSILVFNAENLHGPSIT